MKTFETINDYLPFAKIGDLITFGGRGLLNGLRADSKHDIYRVVGVKNGKIYVKAYRGKATLTTIVMDQQVGLYSKKEFSELPILY